MPGNSTEPFHLYDRTVEPAAGLIRGPAGDVHVEPRAIDLLLRLAADPGKPVSRETIVRDVWNDAPGADASLSVAVSRLRQALADDRTKPRFIETLPKRGYRLLVTPRYPQNARRRDRQTVWAGTVVAVLAAALSATYLHLHPLDHSKDGQIGPAAGRPVVAVLPFRDMSPKHARDYLGEGMADELITRLAQIPGLLVIARTSSFAFAGTHLDANAIARRLGANLVIEGSVVEAQPRVRVRVQLVDAAGRHLWAQSYDRPLEDLLSLQDEISQAVIRGLQSSREIPHGRTIRPSGMTSNNAAYLAYIQARYHVNRRGEKEIRQSIALYEKAVALDSNFARAYEGLAVAYGLMNYWGKDTTRTAQYTKLSVDAAQRALELDDTLAEAYLIANSSADDLEKAHQWDRLVERYSHAMSLEPENPTMRFWHSNLLRDMGYEKAAVGEASLALRLDPYSPIVNYVLGWAYYMSGQPDLALQYALQTRALGATGRFVIAARVYAERGQYAEAQKILAAPPGGYGHDAAWMRLVFSALQNPGDRADTLQTIGAARDIGLTRIDSFAAFDSYAYLGETDLALDALEQALARDYDGAPDYFHMWAPAFSQVRATHRFHDLMKKIGLADYWGRHGWPDYCKPNGTDFRCF